MTNFLVYTGAKVEVIFFLKMTGKRRRLLMIEEDVDYHALCV